jgi:hypothetical protein
VKIIFLSLKQYILGERKVLLNLGRKQRPNFPIFWGSFKPLKGEDIG